MNKPYVQSNFERRVDDDYPTIDPRCVDALLNCIYVPEGSVIVDCCSKNGSAIVEQLLEKGFQASGVTDAFSEFKAQWIVTNPPFKKGIVDKIIWKQINNLVGNADGLAVLVRNNFDFAKSRYEMFNHPYYFAQIHMMFRPWWSEDHSQSPIHNFVWHIWKRDNDDMPMVLYWKED